MGNTEHFRHYRREDVVSFRVTVGEFGGLSNMAPDYPVSVSGIRIPTIEALYQACRYPSRPDAQGEILDQLSPMTAKMKSKKYLAATRPDWERERITIMKWCIRVKLAQNWNRFSSLLLKTENKPIVEDSNRDDFWGAKLNEDQVFVGMNVLGRLLMELRDRIKTGGRGAFEVVQPLTIPSFSLLGRPIERVTALSYEGDVVDAPLPFIDLGN
jgi:ribA/ribD-fused uncharacterized protein